MKKLTLKQSAFVDEYLIDGNATQAAIRAGYSKRMAYSIGTENTKKPQIAAAIQRAREERSEKTKIDANWLLIEAQNLYKECRAEGDRTQANRSLEIIGKHVDVQAFKERIEVEAKIQELSDDDLNKQIAELSTELGIKTVSRTAH